MWCRSNAGHWAVDSPVGKPVDNVVDNQLCQNDHGCGEAELLWLTGSEFPIDRQTLLGELYAERFGLRGKRKR